MQVTSSSTPEAIPLALSALKRGELIIYPTETCYGLGADCRSPLAVSRLLTYKGDRDRQVSLAVSSRSMAEKFVQLNSIADNLYTHFLPGPLTVISQSLHHTDPRLESSNGTLGVRYPQHPFALSLIRAFGSPLTATSANTSGKKEPYSLADYRKYTTSAKQNLISLFLDAGPLNQRPTSTVVDTTLNDPLILRQGELFLPNLPQQQFVSHSPLETQHFAARLARQHLNLLSRYPLLFALQGELGAGKTQFSKGLAQALGIASTVNSPTYILLHEYPYSLPKYRGVFYHLDTWRLADLAELESSLHLSTLLAPGNILSLEWADKAKKTLKQYQNSCVIIYLEIKELDVFTRLITYAVSTPEWT